MRCHGAVLNVIYDVLTVFIESIQRDHLFDQLELLGITRYEYDNIDKLSYIRTCEIAWLIETYLEILEDDDILNEPKTKEFLERANKEFPRKFNTDKVRYTDKYTKPTATTNDAVYWR